MEPLSHFTLHIFHNIRKISFYKKCILINLAFQKWFIRKNQLIQTEIDAVPGSALAVYLIYSWIIIQLTCLLPLHNNTIINSSYQSFTISSRNQINGNSIHIQPCIQSSEGERMRWFHLNTKWFLLRGILFYRKKDRTISAWVGWFGLKPTNTLIEEDAQCKVFSHKHVSMRQFCRDLFKKMHSVSSIT